MYMRMSCNICVRVSVHVNVNVCACVFECDWEDVLCVSEYMCVDVL